MNVEINSKSFILADGATLTDALAVAEVATAGIATAVNGKVVNAATRSETKLNDGDKILIIKAFCGG